MATITITIKNGSLGTTQVNPGDIVTFTLGSGEGSATILSTSWSRWIFDGSPRDITLNAQTPSVTLTVSSTAATGSDNFSGNGQGDFNSGADNNFDGDIDVVDPTEDEDDPGVV